MSSWQVVLLEPARVFLSQIGQFVLKCVGVALILLAGWLISRGIKAVIVKVLRGINIDRLSDTIGLENILEKGGISYSFSELIGEIVYWLLMLVTFMVAFNAVGLTVAAGLLDRIIAYVPNIVLAIFILVLGMFVATLLKNAVLAAVNNAGLTQGKILGKVVEGVVIAFAIFVSLEQLQIGIRITQITISIVLGSMGLGLALAFGLGCKDIAGKFMADFIEKLKKK